MIFDASWGELDLLIDLPPGTGDIHFIHHAIVTNWRRCCQYAHQTVTGRCQKGFHIYVERYQCSRNRNHRKHKTTLRRRITKQ
jgi:hypothetical protein